MPSRGGQWNLLNPYFTGHGSSTHHPATRRGASHRALSLLCALLQRLWRNGLCKAGVRKPPWPKAARRSGDLSFARKRSNPVDPFPRLPGSCFDPSASESNQRSLLHSDSHPHFHSGGYPASLRPLSRILRPCLAADRQGDLPVQPGRQAPPPRRHRHRRRAWPANQGRRGRKGTQCRKRGKIRERSSHRSRRGTDYLLCSRQQAAGAYRGLRGTGRGDCRGRPIRKCQRHSSALRGPPEWTTGQPPRTSQGRLGRRRFPLSRRLAPGTLFAPAHRPDPTLRHAKSRQGSSPSSGGIRRRWTRSPVLRTKSPDARGMDWGAEGRRQGRREDGPIIRSGAPPSGRCARRALRAGRRRAMPSREAGRSR
jgi:hypothetical protein